MHSVTKKLYLDPSTLKLKLPDAFGNSKSKVVECIQIFSWHEAHSSTGRLVTGGGGNTTSTQVLKAGAIVFCLKNMSISFEENVNYI